MSSLSVSAASRGSDRDAEKSQRVELGYGEVVYEFSNFSASATEMLLIYLLFGLPSAQILARWPGELAFLKEPLAAQRPPLSDVFSHGKYSMPGIEPGPRRLRITRKAQIDFESMAGWGETVAHSQSLLADRSSPVSQVDEPDSSIQERSTLGATSTRIATTARITVHQIVARTIGVTTRGDGGTI
jgi:hypothetical protein